MSTNARPKPISLSLAIGRALAQIRADGGFRQIDVALAAHETGMDWTQATVAAIEAGHRQVSAGELLLLPLVIRRLTREPISLADLIARIATEGDRLIEIVPGAPHGYFAQDLPYILDGDFKAEGMIEASDAPD